MEENCMSEKINVAGMKEICMYIRSNAEYMLSILGDKDIRIAKYKSDKILASQKLQELGVSEEEYNQRKNDFVNFDSYEGDRIDNSYNLSK